MCGYVLSLSRACHPWQPNSQPTVILAPSNELRLRPCQMQTSYHTPQSLGATYIHGAVSTTTIGLRATSHNRKQIQRKVQHICMLLLYRQ